MEDYGGVFLAWVHKRVVLDDIRYWILDLNPVYAMMASLLSNHYLFTFTSLNSEFTTVVSMKI